MKKERDEYKAKSEASVNEEKEKELNDLKQEGERLSQKQLVLESTIKKLRATQTENAKIIQELTDRLTNTESLLERKVNRIKELETENQKYIGFKNFKQL